MARDGPARNTKDVREKVAHDKRRRKLQEATAEKLRHFWVGTTVRGRPKGRQYFNAHLAVGSYYSPNQAAIGQWFGQ